MSLGLAFRDSRSAIASALAAVLVLHSGSAFAQSTPPRARSEAHSAEPPDVMVETAPAPAPPSASATALSEARTVRVHIDSPDPVDLGYRAERRGEPAYVCTSPCDITVRAAGRYRIQPSGDVRASGEFTFVGDAPEQTVTVHPATRSGLIGGIVLSATGLASIGVGLLWLMADALSDAEGFGPHDDTVPAVLAIAGAAAVAVGTVLIVHHARTGVNVNSGASTPEESSSSSRRVETGPHVEPHVESGPRFEAGLRPAVFPLLRIAF